MDYTKYIKPELGVLIPVLYVIGMFIKATKIPDYMIPLILGAAGILLATFWMLSSSVISDWQDGLMAVFTGITQGILSAAAAVYVNQLIKQSQNK
jgi:uncharacterized membrane protein